jgi:hypothetical protein
MSGALEQSLAILEYLTEYADGAGLAQISTELAGPSARPDSQAHAAVGPCARALRRRAVDVGGRLPVAEVGKRDTWGNVAEKRVRNVR